jgi:hypothetical protein
VAWVLLLAGLLSGATAVKVHVFTNVTSDYVYPEINSESNFSIGSLQQKPSLGIAISGGQGGWRAAALGYGWLRALHLVRKRFWVNRSLVHDEMSGHKPHACMPSTVLVHS